MNHAFGGKAAKTALEQCKVEKMLCIDHLSSMPEVARGHIISSSVEFLKISIEELEYDSQFDVITSILVNHYMAYDERIESAKNYRLRFKKTVDLRV